MVNETKTYESKATGNIDIWIEAFNDDGVMTQRLLDILIEDFRNE
jgi:hypothetical protein